MDLSLKKVFEKLYSAILISLGAAGTWMMTHAVLKFFPDLSMGYLFLTGFGVVLVASFLGYNVLKKAKG